MYFCEIEMPGKTRVPKRLVKEEVPKIEPERAIIPRADAPPPSDDEDSIDQDIISQGNHLFDISDDEAEAYDDYKYQGKYIIPEVNDKKWRHARAKDGITPPYEFLTFFLTEIYSGKQCFKTHLH